MKDIDEEDNKNSGTYNNFRMLTAQQIQARRIHDEKHKHFYEEDKKRSSSHILMDKFKNYVVLFLETSTIHGLSHLVNSRRHPVEVFLWLVMVMLSVYGTIYISSATWLRYQSSPTVISMDRDMYSFSTPFPSATICPDEKIDPEKLELYLRASKEVDKEKLKRFITTLAHTTFDNFDTVPQYKGIEPRDYLDTLLNLTSAFKPTLTIGSTEVDLRVVPTITEMGLCYSVNSKVAVYNSPEYRKANLWNISQSKRPSYFVHPLDGEVFAQIVNISSYKAYVHGPLEFPDISTKYQQSPSFFYMKIYFTATVVYTSPEASELSVSQRRCRFKHEHNLKHSPVYSYTMCRIECRIQLCLKYCHCIPHFYRRIGDEKVCDVNGLHCLVKYKDLLINLRHKGGKKVDCECYPICYDARYSIQTLALEQWVLGTNFQWGIVTYPRMRYNRDIIFGFTDVLVAVGSMAGLFLGCSVLSFMEIVYFMTLRLICYTKSTLNN